MLPYRRRIILIFSSTNWNLLGKQNKCNTCDKQNYTNNKLYHSHFLCVFFFLPTGFEIRLKTVDKIVLSRCAKYSASAQRPATASCGKAKSVVSKSAEPIVFRRFIFSRFSASVAEKQSRRNAWTQFVYKKCSAEVLQFEPGSGIIEARYQVGVSATKKEDNYGSRTSPRKKRILLRRVELH